MYIPCCCYIFMLIPWFIIGCPVYGSTRISPKDPNEPDGEEKEFGPLFPMLMLEKLSLPLLNDPCPIG
jgi:hypothetical protein